MHLQQDADGSSAFIGGAGQARVSLDDGLTPTSPNPIPFKMEPIAIVGMSCRLPGDVSTPQHLWELCARSRCAWSEIPSRRFDAKNFYHPNPSKSGAFNALGAHFLSQDVALFDAPFFNMTAAEATAVDPQQRIALECTFEAFEAAGIPKEEVCGQPVGVFAGGPSGDYLSNNHRDIQTAPRLGATGTAPCMLSNRISYYFDCRGPSHTTETACSSSLTALHLACQSLRNGECNMAIVVASNLNLDPDQFISLSNSQLFNPEGKSYSFDHRASAGFARGEGIGAIILKRQSDATRAKDVIRAVIRNTGINQDGRTPGITTPNGKSQEALIKQVYSTAGLSMSECGFVEAHGTGTKVGDPIEATALHNTLGQGRTPTSPLYIGSVKSNIGHLEGASGLISTIKAAMILERGLILPNVHFEKPNPAIPLKEWNMKVPVTSRPWPRGKKYLSVCNYGFGGANAHAVLAKAPALEESPEEQAFLRSGRELMLYIISANSRDSLEARAKDLSIYIEQRPDIFEKNICQDLAYTLGQRRSHLPLKLAVVAKSFDELGMKLNTEKFNPQRTPSDQKLAFVCTGQGAQWAGVGRELFGVYPVFDHAMNRADIHLRNLGASFVLSDEILKDKASSRIDSPEIAQPACTAIQCAIIDLLQSWNVRASVTIGHSSGEIAAAYAAGYLTFESSMALAYYRGHATTILKDRLSELRGGMLAVGASADTISPMLNDLKEGYATIACINSPVSVTVSGDDTAVSELGLRLNELSIFNRRLRVDVAYHSKHMEEVQQDYAEFIKDVQPLPGNGTIFHSSLKGRIVQSEELTPSYWVANLISPVEFDQGVKSIFIDSPVNGSSPVLWVEIGSHPQLTGPLKDITRSLNATKLSFLSTLERNKNAHETLLTMAGNLYTKGVSVAFKAVNFPKVVGRPPTLLTDLPVYPWSHNERYWHHSRMVEGHLHKDFGRNDLLGTFAAYSDDLEPIWRNILRLDELPWLRQHKMQGMIVFPLAGYLNLAMEAAYQRSQLRKMDLDKIEVREAVTNRALILNDEADIEIVTKLKPFSEGTFSTSDIWDECRILSFSKGKGWLEHFRCLIGAREKKSSNNIDKKDASLRAQEQISEATKTVLAQSNEEVDIDKMYSNLSNIGCDYGFHFQRFSDNASACETAAHAGIVVPNTRDDQPHQYETKLLLHPAFGDGIIQIVWPIFGAGRQGLDTLYMPTSIKSMTVRLPTPQSPGERYRVYGRGTPNAASPVPTKFRIWVSPENEELCDLVRIEDLTMTPLLDAYSQSSNQIRKLCYRNVWEDIARPKTDEAEQVNGHVHNDESAHDATECIEDSVTNPSDKLSMSSASDIAGPISIVTTGISQNDLAASVSDTLNMGGHTVDVTTLDAIEPEGRLCIVIVELEHSLLHGISGLDFNLIQKLLLQADGVLWVVRSSQLEPSLPSNNLITGLARSIRSENMSTIVLLDLDQRQSKDVKADCDIIVDVFEETWGSEKRSSIETEYVERNGKLQVPRVVEDAQSNELVHQRTINALPFLQPYVQHGRQLKLKIGVPGALDTLHFVDDLRYEEHLGPDQIEIKVEATSMNFKDIVISMGQVPSPYIGVESSGVVSRVGSNVSYPKIGDSVMAMTEGAYSTYTRCLATSAVKIPDGMTFELASTIPVVFCTAYYALKDLGRLESEDKVLIHAAAGGVGQAAIILAQMMGAEIYATVGSLSKKTFLMETYGIPENRIFYSRDTSFGPAIRHETGGKGVDVVINSLANEALRETWNCLAHFGRFIEIGKNDILNNTRLEMSNFENNATFASVDLTVVASERPRLMKRLISDVATLLTAKHIRPIQPVKIFSISELESAFRQLQSGKTIGKIVVTSSSTDQVKALSRKKTSSLRSNASYLIVGGTGGLGRSIARWMAEQGARRIILTSRSSKVSPEVEALKESVGDCAIEVESCDAGDSDATRTLIERVQNSATPIRGIVHAAMVLRDMLFEHMTHEDYQNVVHSKVAGAWNLHGALTSANITPDFVVYLSSVAGVVGNRGQGAYAAANTFLDSFSAFQSRQGIPSTALDLTAVSDVGYLASNEARREEIKRTIGTETLEEAEVLALLGLAIDGSLQKTCGNQCITGLEIPPGATPFWSSDAKFTHLRAAAATGDGAEGAGDGANLPLNVQLAKAEDEPKRVEVLTAAIVDKFSTVLMIPKEDIDTSSSVTSFGLDSLVAIEIRNWIARSCEANLQVLEILSVADIVELAKAILKKSQLKFAN